MECFKVVYIWNSLYGQVPSLGLQWSDTGNRSGHILTVSKLKYQNLLNRYRKQESNMKESNYSIVHLCILDCGMVQRTVLKYS